MLRINSPGGSPVQAGIVNDEIVRLKALHKKVYAVVGTSAPPAPTTSPSRPTRDLRRQGVDRRSIGVLIDGFGFVGTMEKLGVERRMLTAGDNKGHASTRSRRSRTGSAPTRRR